MSIKVSVHKPRDRRNYQLIWNDPETGKQVRRSAETPRRGEAELAAVRLAKKLNEGVEADSRTWAGFRALYERDHLASLKPSTRREWRSVEGKFSRLIDPHRITDVTTPKLMRYATLLREEGLSEDTIDKHLRMIRAALGTAANLQLIAAPPRVIRPKRAKGKRKMKGRPLRLEEFERMLDATEEQCGAEQAASWKHLLEGLWLSGFRLAEALDFWWDDPSKLMPWDLSAKRPTMIIHADLEKGGKDRPCFPLTPDFAEFLRRTPERKRTGPVFAPLLQRGGRPTRSDRTVGKRITAIGEAAGVIVAQTRTPKKARADGEKSDTLKTKFASAHDLRRTFGSRWALRLKPAVLQQLMRHESIETTMGYYVELDSEDLADAIWAGYESSRGGRPNEQFHEHTTESDTLKEEPELS